MPIPTQEVRTTVRVFVSIRPNVARIVFSLIFRGCFNNFDFYPFFFLYP